MVFMDWAEVSLVIDRALLGRIDFFRRSKAAR